MDYIVCKEENRSYFEKIGEYNYCSLEEMALPHVISIDTESDGLLARKNDTFCVQLGTGSNNYIIVLYNNNYTFQELIPYLEEKTLVLHNALFDLGFFYKYGFYPKEVRDTLLASRIIYNGDVENIKHDFKSCMERELNLIYDKTEQKNIHQVKLSVPSTIKYSFNDVDRLLELHDTLEKKIIEGGFEETYALHCRFIRALAYIEQCGLAISSKKWKEKMDTDKANVAIWESKITEYIYDTLPQFRGAQLDLFSANKCINVSLSSPVQMIKVFKAFNIPVIDPKTEKESINENIISKSEHPFVEMWLNFQEANHRVSTFGDSIYQKIENERIYTHFNPMVDTSRLSTRRGEINFLNFPADKETRNCFEANEGNVMVVCDLAGQENVLSADFTKDEAMMLAVKENRDLHSMLTRVLHPDLADKSDEEIMTKYKAERQASKPIRFAFAYGGNAFTIHQNGNIPYNEAVEIETKYKNLHRGIYEWGEAVYNAAIEKGYIESVAGWKLKLPKYKDFINLQKKIKSIDKDKWTLYRIGKEENKQLKEAIEKGEKYVIKDKTAYEFYKNNRTNISNFFKLKSEYQRLCLNSPIQTAGAHQLKMAITLFFEWIIDNNYLWRVKIDNCVHDEQIIECEESLAEITRENLERCMKEGANCFLSELKCGADANIGNSWYSAK